MSVRVLTPRLARLRAAYPPTLPRGSATRVALALVFVMVVVATLVAHYITRVTEWRVMTDELLYLKIARGISDGLTPVPTVHGEHVAVYSILYPLLIAPIVGLLDAPAAFQVIRVFNVVVMVSTAIPAYLLAREASASRVAALLAATMSVLVPWMAQATSLMTEVAAYPAYTWAVYAITRAISAPSTRRDFVALGAIAVACLARTQFVVLLLAFPAAALLHEVGSRAAPGRKRNIRAFLLDGPGAALRAHAVAAIVAAQVVVLLVFASSLLLGSYGLTVSSGGLVPAGFSGSLLEHMAYITVGIGALPVVFAVAFAVGTVGRATDPRAHALASVLVVVVAATTLVVTSFDMRFNGGQVQERYLFYVCPLLFAAAVGWFDRAPRLRLRLATAIAAIATAGLVLSRAYDPIQPFEAFASPNRFSFAVFHGRLRQFSGDLGVRPIGTQVVIAVACLLAPVLVVALLRRGRTRLTLAAFGAGMVAFLAAQLMYVLPKVVAEHNSLAQLFFGNGPVTSRDWLDPRVSSTTGAVEGVINSRAEKPFWFAFANGSVWWELEFWNRSVDRVYRFGERIGDDLTIGPIDPLSLDYASGALDAGGGKAPHQLVLSTSDVRFAPEYRGSPVRHGDLTLYRTPLPYRADWASRNIGQDGWTGAGRPAVVRLYARRGQPAEIRRLRLILHGGADVGGPRRYTLTSPGLRRTGLVRDTASAQIAVCVPAGGHADVALDVHGSTQLAPRSVVGLRVVLIESTPTGRTCSPA